jgi:hypothetical protein
MNNLPQELSEQGVDRPKRRSKTTHEEKNSFASDEKKYRLHSLRARRVNHFMENIHMAQSVTYVNTIAFSTHSTQSGSICTMTV